MSDPESLSIAKQIKRYAQVGGVVGKLATKLASQKYLGVKLDKEKHALEIREALGSIKGPLMKVAQLSATIPDLLPDEYTKELMHLQSNAPPMGWLFVKRRMASELSSDWLKNFKFVRELGFSFIKISKEIIKRKRNLKWTTRDKERQLIKRGRYVEFNLLFDRGTKFGLNTGGNTEAILMSLPPNAKWE